MASQRLLGKTIVITGSSSGIGRSVALALAREGAKTVICADIQPSRVQVDLSRVPEASQSEGLEIAKRAAKDHADSASDDDSLDTHDLICKLYGKDAAKFIQCDVSLDSGLENGSNSVEQEPEQRKTSVLGVKDLVKEAVEISGRLDVWINNAGGGFSHGKVHELSLQDWTNSSSVDGIGSFLGSKYAVQQFLKQDPDEQGYRGSIINVSSIAGKIGIPGCAAYCSSKHAIIGMSKTVAIDYAADGIRSNCICPGYVYTPMLHKIMEQSGGDISWVGKVSPTGRLGRPSDVAETVVWLSSCKESGWVTGSEIVVDGAFTAQ